MGERAAAPFGVVGQHRVPHSWWRDPAKLDGSTLIELVLTNKAAGIPASAARLGAEAGGIRAVFNGQAGAVENFIPMHIGDRHLGGGRNEGNSRDRSSLKASSSNLGSWPVPVMAG